MGLFVLGGGFGHFGPLGGGLAFIWPESVNTYDCQIIFVNVINDMCQLDGESKSQGGL